ncbi:MAG: hypothetical protein ACI8XO_001314 [Verrucomicrobiales bacterium]|jgi:hypothetical protein
MRKILILFWLLVPVAMAAYHYGPGQQLMTVDGVGSTLRQAEKLVAEAKALVEADKQRDANPVFAEAIEKFDEAILNLPKENLREIQRIRLEKAKALFASQKNPTARKELDALLDELNKEKGENRDEQLVDDTQKALAASQFYMTWLMRIEGHPREIWEPEALRSRQNYQALAERAEKVGGTKAKSAKQDLEASVRLALVDLQDLQGLPLPSQ